MTIEEMKAKGFKRYTGVIEKLIVTNEVEVWAKDLDDAEKKYLKTLLKNYRIPRLRTGSDRKFKDWMKVSVSLVALPPRNQR